MNNPLRYQMTEYDCGPTSMLNAVSYLFQRRKSSAVSRCTAWTVLELTAPAGSAAHPVQR